MSDIDRIWQERAEAAEAEIESRIEDRDYWYRIATEAKDQRDRVEATLERVRVALSNHPKTHGVAAPNYPCGWKNAVAEITAALAPVTEEGDKE